jgi:phosphosulfolactate synthase
MSKPMPETNPIAGIEQSAATARPRPNFLSLPDRTSKPRTTGLTHVLDKGVSIKALSAGIDAIAAYADIWKLGWGTAYVDPGVADKVALLAAHDIVACSGGTLLEIAWAQGKAQDFLAWAADTGFAAVEVSNGLVDMPIVEKRRLIQRTSRNFTVLAEVGSKDPQAPVSAEQWRHEMRSDLDAGARWVIAEGRESGTVGIYSGDGSVRVSLVEALLEYPVIFEAPRKDQQAWFIRTIGSNASLGNVAIDDVLSLEALRLGLRADTAILTVPGLADTASAR